MVVDALAKYSNSQSKLEKTFIICEVVNQVRKKSPFGGFVKKDPMSGRYFEVGDFLAVWGRRSCLCSGHVSTVLVCLRNLSSCYHRSVRRHRRRSAMPFMINTNRAPQKRRSVVRVTKARTCTDKVQPRRSAFPASKIWTTIEVCKTQTIQF